ncbi:methionyl-tRNA formyltransferase [bacterium]|nr:methionyl-tRNA formyltransferase [bacterium]
MTRSCFSLVFMGTPDFAVPSLLKLIQETDHKVLGVVTQPDRPSGRGLKMLAPPVKDIALKHHLPLIQPEKIRRSEVKEWLTGLKPDLLVVIAYGKILPKSILAIPTRGSINVHASLLPKYRGAAPINWAIIGGEQETGATTMFMDEGMDTGAVLLQARTEIGPNENAGSLHDRLSVMGANLLIETLDQLAVGTLTPRVQDHTRATYAPLLDKNTGALDWLRSSGEIHNLVRGLSPWPGAFTFYHGRRMKVYETRLADQPHDSSKKPGQFLAIDRQQGVLINTGQRTLWLVSLQPESKGRMQAIDFFNGYHCTFEHGFTTWT